MSIGMIYMIGSIVFDVLVILISIIIVIKKKPGNLLAIVSEIPSILKDTEALFGHGNGANKLRYALSQIKMLCMTMKVDYNEAMFTNKIEDILSTPQAKTPKEAEIHREDVIL